MQPRWSVEDPVGSFGVSDQLGDFGAQVGVTDLTF